MRDEEAKKISLVKSRGEKDQGSEEEDEIKADSQGIRENSFLFLNQSDATRLGLNKPHVPSSLSSKAKS